MFQCTIGLHICTGSQEPFVTWQSDKYQILMLAQKAISVPYIRAANALASLHIRTGWAFVTAPKARVLAQMMIYVPLMQAAMALVKLHRQTQHKCATICALYKCFKNASKWCHCIVIKILNKTSVSLPWKNEREVISFWMLVWKG